MAAVVNILLVTAVRQLTNFYDTACNRQHWTSQGSQTSSPGGFHEELLAVVAAPVRQRGRRLRVQSGAHLHRRRHRDLLGATQRPHARRLPQGGCQERGALRAGTFLCYKSFLFT